MDEQDPGWPDGANRLMGFPGARREDRLYGKSILEYHRREHPGLGAEAPRTEWALDGGFDDMPPAMRSDITLTCGGVPPIIGARHARRTRCRVCCPMRGRARTRGRIERAGWAATG